MQHEELTSKQKFLKNFSSFLSTRWKLLVITLTAILFLTVGAAVYSEIWSSINEKSTILIEKLEDEYALLSEETDLQLKKTKLDEMVKSLEGLTAKYGNFYAGQRALFMKGELLYHDAQYDKAIEIFTAFSSKYKKSYLAPIALNNTAVCQEEAGNLDSALENYKKIIDDYSNDYPDVPHVLFSIGRVYELKNDFTSAAEYYNMLTGKYTNSDWTNLARNRIIYLKISGKITT